jgi:hypothetical protein
MGGKRGGSGQFQAELPVAVGGRRGQEVDLASESPTFQQIDFFRPVGIARRQGFIEAGVPATDLTPSAGNRAFVVQICQAVIG